MDKIVKCYHCDSYIQYDDSDLQIAFATGLDGIYIICPVCGKITSSDCNDRPFTVEILKREQEDSYDKIVRCPRCDVWFGVFR